MAANKSSQKKHKVTDDSILDLTGNPNDELPNAENNDNATPDSDAPKRPMGRKKAKQLLRWGGGDACIEAFNQMWEKKEADAEKEAKEEERFNKALEIEKEKLRLASEGYKWARRGTFEENVRRRKNHDNGPKWHVYSAANLL
jgi:hypothetical protein